LLPQRSRTAHATTAALQLAFAHPPATTPHRSFFLAFRLSFSSSVQPDPNPSSQTHTDIERLLMLIIPITGEMSNRIWLDGMPAN
jgi:hypothetical protein